jgi:hypothetical protein
VAQKIISEKGARIELITIEEDDETSHFYVYITEMDFQRMQKDIAEGKYISSPADYGLVLYEGDGLAPDEKAYNRIKEILADIIKN